MDPALIKLIMEQATELSLAVRKLLHNKNSISVCLALQVVGSEILKDLPQQWEVSKILIRENLNAATIKPLFKEQKQKG